MIRVICLLILSALLSACAVAPSHPSLNAGSLSASATALRATPQLPPLPPARMFVADWDGNGAHQISPDGSRLMWAARKGLNQGLFVKELATGVVHSYAIPFVGQWAEDSKHVIFHLHSGNENTQVSLLDVTAPDTKLRVITPHVGSRSFVHARIAGSNDLLIESNMRDVQVFDLYRYSAQDGALALLAQNPGNVGLWLADRHGKLLGRATQTANQWVYEWWDTTESAQGVWRAAFTVEINDTVKPLQVSEDHRFVWALSNRNRDKTALVKLDLKTGEESVYFSDPRVDVSQAFISNRTGMPLAATTDPGQQEWTFFDTQLSVLAHKMFGDAMRQAQITSMDRDEKWITVSVLHDTGGDHFLVNVLDGESTVLGQMTESRIHAQSPLPERRAIAFDARDGLRLHGYLTLPRDAGGRVLQKVPAVVLVHGGPWARDFWGDQNMPLFLASRGYAVLQVNFRGSTGYGRAFEEAAIGEFAGKMHTDLLDGVEYIKRQGVADPSKVAIMGGSYGGYAALVGMTHSPGTFACAVDLFGVSDWSSLIADAPPYWSLGLFKWHQYVGNPNNPEDAQRMRERSPLHHADKVQGPVLVLQGVRDARVQRDQSTRMVEALRQAGKTVEYVEFAHAGHGLDRWTDRLRYYRKTEDFLAKCLGGRSKGWDFFELGGLIF